MALCQNAITRPGQYRTALDVWVAASGHIERAELLSSTGDIERDKRILAVLNAINSTRPPPNLAQPTTMLILPKPPGSLRPCDAPPPAAQRAVVR